MYRRGKSTIAMRLRCVAFWAVLACGCGGKGEASDTPVLRFTAIPDQNTTLLKEKFGPIATYLSRELGMKCEYVPSTKYSASVEMFRNGDIHLAWFGGLTGVQARQAVPGAKAIAQGVEDTQYYSYFIAHRDTGLTRTESFPSGLRGLKFMFGSQSSTSGRLMPEFFIRENTGQSPEEFFGSPSAFSGSHDKTIELVESGQFQAGVVNYMVYERRVKEGKTDPDVCRIVWKTPFYADYNFTAHPDLEKLFGDGFTAKLRRALIDMKDKKLLSAFPRSGLIPTRNEDFKELADIAKQLDMVR